MLLAIYNPPHVSGALLGDWTKDKGFVHLGKVGRWREVEK
jgi:hypothetical protein